MYFHSPRFPWFLIISRLKDKFENIGSNGYIDIEPKTAKFAGFEVGKLNTMKVKVINAATRPQRVHILPPNSPFFSVKFEKKGLLAAGNSEDLYIQFKPNEYKYSFARISLINYQILL